MNSPLQDERLLPTAFARLLDDDPEVQHEPPVRQAYSPRQLQATVKDDLERLLNTRRRVESWPQACSELESSLLNYGLADFRSLNLVADEGREAFRRMLEDVVRRWEPRFDRVRVELKDNSDPSDPTIRIRIDAVLRAERAPEPVTFDYTFEPVFGNFSVEE